MDNVPIETSIYMGFPSKPCLINEDVASYESFTEFHRENAMNLE